MFSEEICYYWPLNSSVTEKVGKKLLVKLFFCIIYCVTNTVAVMYSKEIPMAEKEFSVFKAK